MGTDRRERWLARAVDDVVAARPVRVGRWAAAAVATAAGVLAGWVAVGAAGVATLAATHPVFWPVGAAFLALFVVMRPRGPAALDAGTGSAPAAGGGPLLAEATPAAAPELHALVGRAAAAAGVAPPARVLVTPAAVVTVADGRGGALVVGTAWWGVLAPAARVAWLAHELAAAGARRRPGARFVALAERALVDWQRRLGTAPAEGGLGRLDRPGHELVTLDPLAASSVLRSELSAGWEARERLLGSVHLAIAAALAGVQRLLVRLAARPRQRAALLADVAAAQAAGTAGLAAALDAVPLRGRAALSAAQAGRRRGTVPVRETVVGHLAAIPPDERARLLARADDAGDAGDGPGGGAVGLRPRRHLAASLPDTPAAVTLGPEAELAVDVELAAAVLPAEEAWRAAARGPGRRRAG